jgi:hypothetical protein
MELETDVSLPKRGATPCADIQKQLMMALRTILPLQKITARQSGNYSAILNAYLLQGLTK